MYIFLYLCSVNITKMDRRQMIQKLEQFKAGSQVPLEVIFSLYAKDGKVFNGKTEIPLQILRRYKNAVRVVIVEGEDPELLEMINEEIAPELIIVESRHG